MLGRMRRQTATLLVMGLLALGLAALPLAVSIDTEVTIVNAPPAVPTLTINGGATAAVTPAVGTTRTVSVVVSSTDVNGGADLVSATVTVKKPDGSTHIAATAASAGAASGVARSFYYNFSMQYYDDPTSVLPYSVVATVTDGGALSATSLSVYTFTYAQAAGLAMDSSAVDFGGTLSAGSSSAIQELVVRNRGNVAIDVQLSGTDLTSGGNTIPVSAIKYSLDSGMASPTSLSTSSTTKSDFDLSKRTAGADSADSIYWQLTVPSVPSGTYSGTIDVTAVAG